jgi:hypothetical protein
MSGFLDPSPTLLFDLLRKREDGTIETVPFRCRLLKKSQTDDAQRLAQEHASKREKAGYNDIYREAQAVEVLALAIVHPEKHERADGTSMHLPMFINSQQLRDSLNTEDLAQMLRSYQLTSAHYGFSDLSDEGIVAMIDGLSNEMTGAYFLSRVDSDEWPRLIYALAQMVRSLRPSIVQTPSDWVNSSELGPLISESGTTGSLTQPELRSAKFEIESSPTMSKEQALEIVRSQANETRISDPNDGT